MEQNVPLSQNPNPLPLPVIVIRTPYGAEHWYWHARIYVERGYRVMVQDTRGRFNSSGGEFMPIAHEKEDGGSTLAWLKQQKWCNGE